MSAYRKYLKVVRKARKPAVIALWPGYKRRGTWFVIIDYAEKKDYDPVMTGACEIALPYAGKIHQNVNTEQ